VAAHPPGGVPPYAEVVCALGWGDVGVQGFCMEVRREECETLRYGETGGRSGGGLEVQLLQRLQRWKLRRPWRIVCARSCPPEVIWVRCAVLCRSRSVTDWPRHSTTYVLRCGVVWCGVVSCSSFRPPLLCRWYTSFRPPSLRGCRKRWRWTARHSSEDSAGRSGPYTSTHASGVLAGDVARL
jgi:hypothetical protein